MTRAAIVLALPFVWGLTAAAGDDDAKKLAGTWEARGDAAHTWTFEQTDKGLHVIETENGKNAHRLRLQHIRPGLRHQARRSRREGFPLVQRP